MNDTNSHLIESIEGRVVTITFNRPKSLNAVTRPMLQELHSKLVRLRSDDNIGVIIITGAGKAFCAGGDVKSMASGRDDDISLEKRAHMLRQRMEVARLLHEIDKPTIAMVRGPAAGAGMSIALACDIRLASVSAKIITSFSKVALSGDFGGSWFLTKLVGAAKARELYFFSDKLNAKEALSLGLFNKIFSEDALESETLKVAHRLADGPSVALGFMKKNLNAALTQPLSQCLDIEALHHACASQTLDHREAALAFVEKRNPAFIGK